MEFLRSNARWLAAGLALTFASSFGQTFFISLFAGEIKAEFDLSDGGWGSLYTAATLASALVLFQLGVLADRARLDRLAIGVALAYAAVAAAMALNPSLVVLGVLVFGLRLCGQGMMSHLAVVAMGRWFQSHRGRAVAIAGLGFSVGEALLPTATVAAIALVGWRGVWGLVAAVLVFALVPLFAWLLGAARQPQGAGGDDGLTVGMAGRHWPRGEVLGHWSFWCLMPGVLTPSFIGTVLFFHQVRLSEEKGWDLISMALGYPAYAGLTILASLTGGALVDRFGPTRILPLVLVPLGAAGVVLAVVGPVVLWVLILALTGLTQGLIQPMWGAMWAELYGTRHLGAVRAAAITAMVLSTAIGPGLTGLLIDGGVDFQDQGFAMAGWCAGVTLLHVIVAIRLRAALAADSGGRPA